MNYANDLQFQLAVQAAMAVNAAASSAASSASSYMLVNVIFCDWSRKS